MCWIPKCQPDRSVVTIWRTCQQFSHSAVLPLCSVPSFNTKQARYFHFTEARRKIYNRKLGVAKFFRRFNLIAICVLLDFVFMLVSPCNSIDSECLVHRRFAVVRGWGGWEWRGRSRAIDSKISRSIARLVDRQ